VTDRPLEPGPHADLVCALCLAGPPPHRSAGDGGGVCTPIVVVRLPGGPGEPEVSLEAGGRTVIVRRRAGPRTWEHQVDLPFAASAADLSWSSGDCAMELRVALPGDLLARARRPLAIAT
jgi:hypothetical protein